MRSFTILLASIVALLRPMFLFETFNPHVTASYQAVAHFLVGGLFAVGYTNRNLSRRLLSNNPIAFSVDDLSSWTITAAWLLTAIEVVCGIMVPLAKHFITVLPNQIS